MKRVSLTVNGVATSSSSSRASCSSTSCASGSASPERTSAATRRRAAPARCCSTASRSSRARCSRVQADGARVDDDRGARRRTASCIRSSRRSTSSTRCSAATARPGWSWPRSSLLDENAGSVARRRSGTALEGNLCRCTGYHNIVKAQSQARRRRVGGVTWHASRDGRPLRRRAGRAQGGSGAPHRPGALRRRHRRSPGWSGSPSCAARTRTRGSTASTSRRARAAAGVVAAFSGADLADEWAGGAAVRVAGRPRTSKRPTHWPLAVDKARYAGDGVAVVVAESRALGEGRGRARRGRLRAAAGGHRRRGGARRRRADRARRARHEPLLHVDARRPASRPACSPRRR